MLDRCYCINKVHTGKFVSKFKDFSRTFKSHSYCFQGLKTYENTDLHNSSSEMLDCITKDISLKKNKYEIVLPLYAAPNKGITIL